MDLVKIVTDNWVFDKDSMIGYRIFNKDISNRSVAFTVEKINNTIRIKKKDYVPTKVLKEIHKLMETSI